MGTDAGGEDTGGVVAKQNTKVKRCSEHYDSFTSSRTFRSIWFRYAKTMKHADERVFSLESLQTYTLAVFRAVAESSRHIGSNMSRDGGIPKA